MNALHSTIDNLEVDHEGVFVNLGCGGSKGLDQGLADVGAGGVTARVQDACV